MFGARESQSAQIAARIKRPLVLIVATALMLGSLVGLLTQGVSARPNVSAQPGASVELDQKLNPTTSIYTATADATETDGTSADVSEHGVATVLQINGLLDEIVADFVIDSITEAEADGQKAVVLQVDSKGVVVDDERLQEFAQVLANTSVPTGIWVGPSGAVAEGDWVDLAALVDRVGIPLGSKIGNAPTQTKIASAANIWGSTREAMVASTFNSDQAAQNGVASYAAPTLGDFMVGMSELGVKVEAVDTSTQLLTQVRLSAPSVFKQQLHTAASPPVAYLMFIIGLGLFVFEFYTAGVGVAGGVGAVFFLLGSYGLGALPISLWALVLLVLSVLAFAVDVQSGVPRFWSAVGAIGFIVATLFLFNEPASMSWLTKLVGIGSMIFAMISGMPTMIRTRYSTPTIGREWMIGEMGEAVEAVAPNGVVRVKDALWKAQTNRATPIELGEPVRVIGVEGLWLEVEPESGAARDYRDRSPRE